MTGNGAGQRAARAAGPLATPRGRLIVFLGIAPGAGKTSAMLVEGRRLADQGVAVVVGLAETHGRADTEDMLAELERIPPRRVSYREGTFDELDVDALLERHPEVALVDELAHRCVPGSRHEKRWEDVDELLDAGVDVVTTLNVQHLDSLGEAVEALTGVAQRETVPDAVVASAERVELVDVTPEQLRHRIAEKGVLASEVSGTALAGFYSREHLDGLRELAHRWLADHGPRGLSQAGLSGRGPGAGGHVVVALAGDPEAEHVLRRAAQIAQASGAGLVGVYVRVPSDAVEAEPPWLGGQRRLLGELGGRYTEVAGIDVAAAVLDFARSEGATQLVLGATRRSRTEQLLHGSVINKAIRSAGPLEVHVIPPRERLAHPERPAPAPAHGQRRTLLPGPRRAVAWVLAVALPVVVTCSLIPVRSSLQLSGILLCNLLAVVGVALLGGIRPAVLATVVAFVASDFFYAPPFYSLRLNRLVDLIALVTFLVVAGAVGALVDLLTRQGFRVARARAEAENLARLAADTLVGSARLDEAIGSFRRTFDLDGVSLLRWDGEAWRVEATDGAVFFDTPDAAPRSVEVGSGLVLACAGGAERDQEADLLQTFLEQLRITRERDRLTAIGGDPGTMD